MAKHIAISLVLFAVLTVILIISNDMELNGQFNHQIQQTIKEQHLTIHQQYLHTIELNEVNEKHTIELNEVAKLNALLNALKEYLIQDNIPLRYPKWNGIIEINSSNISCSNISRIACALNQQLEQNITPYIIELQEKYPSVNNWDTGWNLYRFGDMFRFTRQRKKSAGYWFHKTHYPTSIATEYMDNINRDHDESNYTVLRQIIKKRTQSNGSLSELIKLSDEYQLIIHLRTGDVLDMWDYSTSDVLVGNRRSHWLRSLTYYQNVLQEIKRYNLTHVLFITGYTGISVNRGKHKNHHKSIEYIAKILKLFEMHGYKTSLRVNENPDDDMILMMSSHYFAQAGGGYSEIIANVVKMNNGTVFSCPHDAIGRWC